MAKMNPAKLKPSKTALAKAQERAIGDDLAYSGKISRAEYDNIKAMIKCEAVQNLGQLIVQAAEYYSYAIQTRVAHATPATMPKMSELLEMCELIRDEACKYPIRQDLARLCKSFGLNISTGAPFRAIAEEYDPIALRKRIGNFHSKLATDGVRLAKYEKTEEEGQAEEEEKAKKNATRPTPYGRVLKLKNTLDNIRNSKKDPAPLELIQFIDEKFMPLFQWIEDGEHPLTYTVATAETAEKYQAEHPSKGREQSPEKAPTFKAEDEPTK